ncbi:MAG: hypothetical protein QOG55_2815 [Acidobacteriaceae bacterium]|jgi:hypothetical protein|nr:hypothetical protein [Acidobacteriaceae bacterium]
MSYPQIVLGRYLAGTSFDSGSLVPNEDEVIAGWESRGGIAYSPEIESVEKLPHDLYDEWYLFEFPRELGNLFQGNVFETRCKLAKSRPSLISAVSVCITRDERSRRFVLVAAGANST